MKIRTFQIHYNTFTTLNIIKIIFVLLVINIENKNTLTKLIK